MALHLEDRLPLLNLNDSLEEEIGYDSPVFVSDSGLSSPGSDSDYPNSGCSTDVEISSDDDDESDDLDDLDDPLSVNFTSTDPLVNNMKYILSMPDLCDVTFCVGPHRLPVQGLKAVIASRSQVLQEMILQHHQVPKKSKKNEKPSISIYNYDIDVFKQLIHFVHTGHVVMDVTTVVGLTCASIEFEIQDLENACWGYFRHCTMTPSNISILQNQADSYCNHRVTEKIRSLLRESQDNSQPSSKRKETVV